MLKTWIGILAVLASLAACAPLPPAPEVRIEGTPGVAVIYIVRTNPDLSYVPAQISFDDRMLGVTYAGTYFRVEAPAGRHRIAGYGVDAGTINLDVQAGSVYFVQQTVASTMRSPTSLSSFYRLIDETRARKAMAGASPAG